MYYATTDKEIQSKESNPKSSTAPKTTRQKKMIYELVSKVTRGKFFSNRKYATYTFFSIIPELKNLILINKIPI